MHTMQPTENRDRDEIPNQTSAFKESKASTGLYEHDLAEERFSEHGFERSFEEEDISVKSDDLSRSEADNFQTPSTSLQNLSLIQQNQPNETEDKTTEIRSEIDSKSNGNGFNQNDIPKTGKQIQISPQGSMIESVSSDKDGKGGSPNSQVNDPLTGSPAGSISLSPSNASARSDLTQSTESNISRESNSSGTASGGGGSTVNGSGSKDAGLLQPGTYNSKPGRKKMWYHVFTPSYKTRSTDFRKYFKDLPGEERLIVDYSCALQKEILVQGRMYISQSYISFYANIFGWQTLISIKLKDISNITKEHTALVIPNAVQVVTGSEKYFFTSFVNRDSTYIMLFKLWQTALLDQNMPPKEIWKLVHACYGEVEMGSEEEEESNEDYLSLSSTGSLVNAPSVSTLLSISDEDDTKSVDIARTIRETEMPSSSSARLKSGTTGSEVSSASSSTTPKNSQLAFRLRRSTSDINFKTAFRIRRRSKSRNQEMDYDYEGGGQSVETPAAISSSQSSADLRSRKNRLPILSFGLSKSSISPLVSISPIGSLPPLEDEQTNLETVEIPGKRITRSVSEEPRTKFSEEKRSAAEFSAISLKTIGNRSSPPISSDEFTDKDIRCIENNQVCSGELEFPSGILGPAVITTSSGGIVNATQIVNAAAGNLTNKIISVDLIPTDLSDSSDSEEEQIIEDLSIAVPACTSPHGDGKTVVDAIIPCNVDTLFTMLFTNSKFYLDFHTSRKTFDIVQQEWQEKDGQTTRQVSFTVTLNQRMGPKHSQITETQILLTGSKPGYFYAVDVESNNSGIPYADAFFVTCHFCLSLVAPLQSRLVIVAQVRYRKSIWGLTKSFIEKNSWVGIEDFYSSLEKSLKDECANLKISNSTPPSPRPSQHRRRPLRKKGPAPGIPTGVSLTGSTASIPTTVAASGGGTGAIVEPTLITSIENPVVLKVIVSILATLLVLNGFLYVKLTSLESNTGSPIFFAPQPITFTKEMPQTHQEWLELLQQQEALHRFELQKWHDILLSSLKVIKQAETDLKSLKFHIDSYAQARMNEPSFIRSQKADTQHSTSDNPNNKQTEQPSPSKVEI